MKLRKDHNLGSGYPSDPVTVKFVKKYYKKNKIMPNFVRKSWKPVQKIIGKN
jgi:ribonuclease HII